MQPKTVLLLLAIAGIFTVVQVTLFVLGIHYWPLLFGFLALVICVVVVKDIVRLRP